MQKTIFAVLGICMAACFVPAGAQAQQPMALSGARIQFSEDQKLQFEAARKVMQHDYRAANDIYTRMISMNGGNINTYLQRGVIRREMGDMQGAAADASAVVTLANNALPGNPNNADLYYERGMGFRLLQNFTQAERDIRRAIQISGQTSWQTDLQATELEEKEAAVR